MSYGKFRVSDPGLKDLPRNVINGKLELTKQTLHCANPASGKT